MTIAGLTCTNGRFNYLKRLLRCFLSQDYGNKLLIIYNNAAIPIKMKKLPNVVLVNNNIDYHTNQPYGSVGSIFRDALTHIPDNVDYISIMDDDDIYLKNHFSDAIKQLSKDPALYKVWKPGLYFFKYSSVDVEYLESDNNLEASCIIEHSFLRTHGFHETESVAYNLSWLNEAQKRGVLKLDKEQETPSYCYEFYQHDVFHVSSIRESFLKSDFDKKLLENGDFGDNQILEPWTEKEFNKFIEIYFNLKNFE